MSIAKRIKQLRTELQLTQHDFGRDAGVSKQAVSQWERDLTTPERNALLSLRKKHHINARWIIYGEPPQRLSIATQINEPAAAYQTDSLTDEQKTLIKLFSSLTQTQKTELLQSLKDKKQANDDLLAELTARKD